MVSRTLIDTIRDHFKEA